MTAWFCESLGEMRGMEGLSDEVVAGSYAIPVRAVPRLVAPAA
jgi:hypothetical protein